MIKVFTCLFVARAMRAMMREHNAAFETFNSADDNSMSDEESEVRDAV